MTHGELTTHLAEILTQEFDQYGIDVLYDHGQQTSHPNEVGEIASWFGESYNAETRLALLDIALVERATNKAIALIEIEETTDKPKVLIGDILAILLGDGIKFRGERILTIESWTTLIILGHYSHVPNWKRVHHLEKHANYLKSSMTTGNAHIGEIVFDLFDDSADLKAKAIEQIKHARRRFS
jgi:hypothetical protein